MESWGLLCGVQPGWKDACLLEFGRHGAVVEYGDVGDEVELNRPVRSPDGWPEDIAFSPDGNGCQCSRTDRREGAAMGCRDR